MLTLFNFVFLNEKVRKKHDYLYKKKLLQLKEEIDDCKRDLEYKKEELAKISNKIAFIREYSESIFDN